MKKHIMAAFLISVLAASVVYADVLKSTIDDQTAVEVTVYNSNVGLVKDLRTVRLPKSVGELQFMDVAASINPVTVAVKSLNAPDQFMILEQNYEYDLMNAQKLMDKYVGQKVKIVQENFYTGESKEVTAELLSNNNGAIYKIDDEIYLGYNGQVVLPQIPENLIAKPTLTWMFQNESTRPHDLEVSYLTHNINWNADYVMTVNQDDTLAGLNGWVTIDNRSGTQYKDAKLKLVAGEVNRVESGRHRRQEVMYDMAAPSMMAEGFQEEAFFEYHIYDLQRPTTIKHNQKKQISLLEAEGVNIDKEYIVRGQQHFYRSSYRDIPDAQVGVFLKFKNEEENNLGMPLPAGTIRLYKADTKNKLQFIGEDRIDHTPKDEEITLKIGDAFDIVAERKQMDYQNLNNRAHETAWEVVIRNHKEEDIVVNVLEPLYGEWYMRENSHDYEKLDAFTVKFKVPVKKDGEAKLTYRVRVNYR